MPILNIFKKKESKKRVEKKEEPEKTEKPKERIKEKPEKREEIPGRPQKERKREVKIAPLVLEAPHITEKATRLGEENQYVFRVSKRATKPEIKRAIEEVYGVEVIKVRTIKMVPKRRRLGRSVGWKKGYKKAIVKIKEGQKIEILPR